MNSESGPKAPAPEETPSQDPAIGPTASDAADLDHAADLPGALAAAEAKAKEHHEAWLRAAAETENVRKRAQDDIARAHKYALEKFAAELLQVKDSLEAALNAESQSVESLRAGVEVTLKQLAGIFERQQIREIDPAGAQFDPHRHEAISMLPSEKEPNTVINVLQKGYLLHDRVIRPALVTVAKPKEA
ncbi:MAG: nucleotide exchange factor GrpE [Gammaproteobacteria bacterium]|nr:nucleotide exchange factor GrpE [Gammaproteobacteria bacterium]